MGAEICLGCRPCATLEAHPSHRSLLRTPLPQLGFVHSPGAEWGSNSQGLCRAGGRPQLVPG